MDKKKLRELAGINEASDEEKVERVVYLIGQLEKHYTPRDVAEYNKIKGAIVGIAKDLIKEIQG